MRHLKSYSILFLSGVILLFMTTSCCEDALGLGLTLLVGSKGDSVPKERILIEEIYLSNEAKDFIPYPETERSYLFTNKNGDKEILEGGKDTNYSNSINTYLDKQADKHIQEYYRTIGHRINLNPKDGRKIHKYDPAFIIRTKIEIDTSLLPARAAFIEYSLIKFSYQNSLSTEFRIDHNSDTINYQTVKILDEIFEEVFVGIGEETGKVYYNKKYGVVGYEDQNGVEWVLNRLKIEKTDWESE